MGPHIKTTLKTTQNIIETIVQNRCWNKGVFSYNTCVIVLQFTYKILFLLGESPAWSGNNNRCDTGQREHPWGWSDHSAGHGGPHSHPYTGPTDASTNERAPSQGMSYQTKISTVLHRFDFFFLFNLQWVVQQKFSGVLLVTRAVLLSDLLKTSIKDQ